MYVVLLNKAFFLLLLYVARLLPLRLGLDGGRHRDPGSSHGRPSAALRGTSGRGAGPAGKCSSLLPGHFRSTRLERSKRHSPLRQESSMVAAAPQQQQQQQLAQAAPPAAPGVPPGQQPTAQASTAVAAAQLQAPSGLQVATQPQGFDPVQRFRQLLPQLKERLQI
ncbi:uncharacterized protein LOC143831188 [Paroedura picta]|uniref:uncharacterized protein LOC143831188 n=1 Tax=Paroedura picta TaxID=143630 RepID=UPI004056734A